MNYLNVFLTNLDKYNEGELVGEWFHLPADEEEIEEAMKRIGIGETDEFGQPYEEYFITDYDSYIGSHRFGEYENIYELNETIKEIADCVQTKDELEIFKAILNEVHDMEEAISIFKDKDYVDYSYLDSAYALAGEFVCLDLLGCPDYVVDYFDYEAYGRDLLKKEWFVEMENGGYIQIIR